MRRGTKKTKKQMKKRRDAGRGSRSSHYKVIDILCSIFSNYELNINNQQIYNSNRLYAHKSYVFNNSKGAIFENKGASYFERYDYEEFLDEIMEAPLSEASFTRRMKLLHGTARLILYGKRGVDFFSTFELLYPNKRLRLRLIIAQPNSYKISDKPNFKVGTVD